MKLIPQKGLISSGRLPIASLARTALSKGVATFLIEKSEVAMSVSALFTSAIIACLVSIEAPSYRLLLAAPSLLPLERACSLSRTKTATANPRFGLYIIHTYLSHSTDVDGGFAHTR